MYIISGKRFDLAHMRQNKSDTNNPARPYFSFDVVQMDFSIRDIKPAYSSTFHFILSNVIHPAISKKKDSEVFR